MDTLAKADIFFVVTTVAVVIAGGIFAVAGFYVIQTLRNVRDISEKAKKTVDSATRDVKKVRKQIVESPLGKMFAKNKAK